MRRLLLCALVATIFAGCAKSELDSSPTINNEHETTLFGGFDSEEATRIQLNEAQKTVWNAGDEVSVFYRTENNERWRYEGEDLATSGPIRQAEEYNRTATTEEVVVAYPYSGDYTYDASSNLLSASLPREQQYMAASYGKGGGLMVAQTLGNGFSLKNCYGWLQLNLMGNGERVKSITLRGNNGEALAFNASIDATTAAMSIANEENSSRDVVLQCPDAGVVLSATATPFYIAVAPQSFTKGVTLEIACIDGNFMTKSYNQSITVERNHIVPTADVAFKAVDVIEIVSVGRDMFSFKVNIEGDYLYYPYPKLEGLYNFEQKAIRGSGVKTYIWKNGEMIQNVSGENITMEVNAGVEYGIAVAKCDANGKVVGSIFREYLTTEAAAAAEGVVTVTTSNITTSSVDIKCEPDGGVKSFYLYVVATATYESMVAAGYGSMYATVIKNNGWSSSTTLERTWEGLSPNTKYSVLLVVVDTNDGESLIDTNTFTTAAE